LELGQLDLLYPHERWETGIGQEGYSVAIHSEGAAEGGVECTLEFPDLSVEGDVSEVIVELR